MIFFGVQLSMERLKKKEKKHQHRRVGQLCSTLREQSEFLNAIETGESCLDDPTRLQLITKFICSAYVYSFCLTDFSTFHNSSLHFHERKHVSVFMTQV